IHIGTIILVCSPEPGTLSILQRPHSDAPASRTLPTTACQSHGSIDWPCQIYNISHFILSTLLYKNSEGHIHCQRVNFCMSSGECVHTVSKNSTRKQLTDRPFSMCSATASKRMSKRLLRGVDKSNRILVQGLILTRKPHPLGGSALVETECLRCVGEENGRAQMMMKSYASQCLV